MDALTLSNMREVTQCKNLTLDFWGKSAALFLTTNDVFLCLETVRIIINRKKFQMKNVLLEAVAYSNA